MYMCYMFRFPGGIHTDFPKGGQASKELKMTVKYPKKDNMKAKGMVPELKIALKYPKEK